MKTAEIEERLSASIPAKPKKTKQLLTGFLLVLLAAWSAWQTEFSLAELTTGFPNMLDLIVQLFPPDWSYFSQVTSPLLETIRMAIIGTTFGALLAIPFSLLSARNVFPSGWVTTPVRMIMNLIRTMPDLLLASLFVAVFGIGPVSGVFALTFFSLGIIAKLVYEAIESVDKGPLEAMTAVGANKIKWISFGVIPQALPHYMSFVLYAFEINIRAAAILGLVGAGGIGLYYDQTLGFFEYDKTATLILYTFIAVLMIDYVSAKIREKLR